MDVYVMGIVYCPMARVEQDMDICLSCKNFAGFTPSDMVGGNGSAVRTHINCGYSGKSRGIFLSSKSKRVATFITDEPFPPTPLDDEEWQRASM